MQVVMFTEENPQDAISDPKDSTLLAWFQLNR